MSGIEIALAAAAVGGTALNVYGNISGANAQEEAAQRNAALKREQADELLDRQIINERIMRRAAEKAERGYVASFASTGRGGGGVGGVLQIKEELEENIANTRRDAEFKAKMLRAGADIETSLASDAVSAAWISGAGTILTTGAQAYGMISKYGPAKGGSKGLWG